ncbi:hypothetical protein [Lysobacter capsici]|uniref:hypothetical protein n=1 Tax=Lysobacter capsici TaxID=435897 RepID=UPI001364D6DF|nr:hypothetical protein [Lysobacter capsici]
MKLVIDAGSLVGVTGVPLEVTRPPLNVSWKMAVCAWTGAAAPRPQASSNASGPRRNPDEAVARRARAAAPSKPAAETATPARAPTFPDRLPIASPEHCRGEIRLIACYRRKPGDQDMR